MSKIGYGLSRQEIPDVVKNLLDRAVSEGYILPDDKRFCDNRPSKNWVNKFFIRHPSLAARTPENFGFRRTSVTEETIRNWFNTLADYLEQEHKIDVKTFFVEENSKRIFNIDESGFPLQGTNHRLKVVAMKGAKNVYRVAPDTKEQITVLACVSADGSFNKPLVVYPGARTPKFNFGGGVNPDHYSLGYSQNGWMTADVNFYMVVQYLLCQNKRFSAISSDPLSRWAYVSHQFGCCRFLRGKCHHFVLFSTTCQPRIATS